LSPNNPTLSPDKVSLALFSVPVPDRLNKSDGKFGPVADGEDQRMLILRPRETGAWLVMRDLALRCGGDVDFDRLSLFEETLRWTERL